MEHASTNSFSKLFAQRAGRSLHDWPLENDLAVQIDERVERARLLLLTGDHSVDEVVKLSGFRSRPALDKAFKKIHGVPPANWLGWKKRGVVIERIGIPQ